MKHPEEQIDTLFTQGLSSYEETPSPQAWNAIENQLPSNKSKFNYWIAASVVATLLVSAGIWNTIISKTNTSSFKTAAVSIQATHPQPTFIAAPVIIRATTIVYVQVPINSKPNDLIIINELATNTAKVSASNLEIKPISSTYLIESKIDVASTTDFKSAYEPITIIYKKGDPKHPMFTKAASYLKQVSDGDRPLVDFGKITTGLMARRDNINNSNN